MRNQKKSQRAPDWVVKPIVPEEVYTNRAEFLDYFYHAALEAAHRRTISTVLLGQRRMGKTEIFKRVVNRLFFEQDPHDPHAVMPVYYSFPDMFEDKTLFAKEYIENFMRYYVGFYTRQPQLVEDNLEGERLISRIEQSRSSFPFTRTLDLLLAKHESILTGDATYPPKTAVQTPRMISDIDDSTIVMFLDEFRNTRLPQYNFEIVGWMQDAVESPTCPHFVTGSAMSILAREIIGRGSLFGRFDGEEIRPMSEYWAAELALKAAYYYQADVPELMAPVIADRCGGNPFYITAVIRTEVFMSQVLLNSQRRTLPGRLFHSLQDITMPSMFTYIRHRVRLGSGEGKEIDVFGAAGNEAWVCQSKWLTRDKVGIPALRVMIEQANLVQEDIRRDTLRMWLFAYNGLTREAEQFAQEHGILWSSVQEFNELLQQVGLRPLPEV